MKSKIYLVGLAFTLLLSFSACKSKQSHYQQSYETAKAQEAANNQRPAEVFPIAKPATTESFQSEKLIAVDGNNLGPFSVVIGSFVNRTNAESLKNRMVNEGYNAILAQNERNMYRVIVATYNDRDSAAAGRKAIQARFAPEFSDAWLLQQVY
jgi:cell division septation protein DedD